LPDRQLGPESARQVSGPTGFRPGRRSGPETGPLEPLPADRPDRMPPRGRYPPGVKSGQPTTGPKLHRRQREQVSVVHDHSRPAGGNTDPGGGRDTVPRLRSRATAGRPRRSPAAPVVTPVYRSATGLPADAELPAVRPQMVRADFSPGHTRHLPSYSGVTDVLTMTCSLCTADHCP
jgi:hypothetical protein